MFDLSLNLTELSIKSLKLDLARQIPNIKSSHRCEALARGLGCRTYASLKANVGGKISGDYITNGKAFSAYLRSHGFDESPNPFYRAIARSALHSVMERVPLLTVKGFGYGQPQFTDDGRLETTHEQFVRFQLERADLYNTSSVESFLLSLAFLSRVVRTKTNRPKSGSYWIKHIAENFRGTYPDGTPLGPKYISNGIFIAAAVQKGFDIRSYELDSGYSSLNVTFNMAYNVLVDLDCKIRPEGSNAQTKRWRESLRALGSLRSTYQY